MLPTMTIMDETSETPRPRDVPQQSRTCALGPARRSSALSFSAARRPVRTAVPARRAGAVTAPPGRTGGSAARRRLSCGDSVASHSLGAGDTRLELGAQLSRAGGHCGACSGPRRSPDRRGRPVRPGECAAPGAVEPRRQGPGGSCARCHRPPRASRAARGGVAALLSAPKPQKTPASCKPNNLSLSFSEFNSGTRLGAGKRPRKKRGPPITAFEQDTLLELRNTFGQAFLQGGRGL